jgi:hypothetical protein
MYFRFGYCLLKLGLMYFRFGYCLLKLGLMIPQRFQNAVVMLIMSR